MPTIYPSLIGADQLNLACVIQDLDPYCAGYHLDVMDAHFVPNLTMGPLVINAIAQVTTRHLWVHLMVDNPISMIDLLEIPEGSLVSFHVENNDDHKKIIKRIKEKKLKPGVALNPKTPVTKVFELLDLMIDHVLIMAVEPGFSGQKFIPEVRTKVAPLVEMRTQKGLAFSIGIDGGVDESMIQSLVNDGIDMFAIASGIFNTSDPVAALQRLNALAQKNT